MTTRGFLDEILPNTRRLISEGYYASRERSRGAHSFTRAIWGGQRIPIIAEVKPASPTMGRADSTSTGDVLAGIGTVPVLGVSVLTEPHRFGGSLGNLDMAGRLDLPVLMKDFIIHEYQLGSGYGWGADAALLIERVFDGPDGNRERNALIDAAHDIGLEVLLEVNSPAEYGRALGTEADILGINNRDLVSLEVSLDTTRVVLEGAPKDRPVISMSGVHTPEDIRKLMGWGADGVLVGTSLMKAPDYGAKLRELAGAFGPMGAGAPEKGGGG